MYKSGHLREKAGEIAFYIVDVKHRQTYIRKFCSKVQHFILRFRRAPPVRARSESIGNIVNNNASDILETVA